MAAVTRVDAVIDKLVAMFDVVVDTVLDGPNVDMLNHDSFVVVGDDGDFESDEPVVDIEQTPAAIRAGSMPRWEEATVTCTAYGSNGDMDVSAARAQAVALVQACEGALTASQNLEGVVQHAWLTVGNVRQDQTGSEESGASVALVRIEFGIYYKARLA